VTITDLKTHPKAFVTLDEYAAYLDVTVRTLYHQIDKGSLKAVKHGGALRIPLEEAQRFASVPAR